MSTGSHRVHFIDLLRGFAVVLMVIGHTVDSVLDLERRSTEWFEIYNFVRGFTAPAFLFVSGLAFAPATERKWNDYLSWSPALRKRVRRVLLLFCIGYALHLPYFSLQKSLLAATADEIAGFLSVDVLQCIAACLLILHSVIITARTPAAFIRTIIGLTVVIVLSTPVVWATDLSPALSPVLSPFVNDKPFSVFPLFPYAAFMFCGVITGHFFLRAATQDRAARYVVTLGIGSAVCATAGVMLDLLPATMYPEHDFWKTSPLFFLLRIAAVMQLTILFYFLRTMPGRVQTHLTTLGQSSLLIYSVHILFVYGSAANPGLFQVVGQTQPVSVALIAGVVMLTLMLLLAHGWDYLRSSHVAISRYVQAGLASVVLYLFLLRPF